MSQDIVIKTVGSACVTGGKHNFEAFLKRSSPPSQEVLETCNVSDLEADFLESVIQALSVKEFVVVCKDCGLVCQDLPHIELTPGDSH